MKLEPRSVKDLYQRGKIVGLFGTDNTGKTTWGLKACAQVVREGGLSVYVDFDLAMMPDYATSFGIPVERKHKFLHLQPNTMEDGLGAMLTLLRTNSVDLVVVDSVVAAISLAEYSNAPPETFMDSHAHWNVLWAQYIAEIRETLAKVSIRPAVLLLIPHRSWELSEEGEFCQRWKGHSDEVFFLKHVPLWAKR